MYTRYGVPGAEHVHRKRNLTVRVHSGNMPGNYHVNRMRKCAAYIKGFPKIVTILLHPAIRMSA